MSLAAPCGHCDASLCLYMFADVCTLLVVTRHTSSRHSHRSRRQQRGRRVSASAGIFGGIRSLMHRPLVPHVNTQCRLQEPAYRLLQLPNRHLQAVCAEHPPMSWLSCTANPTQHTPQTPTRSNLKQLCNPNN